MGKVAGIVQLQAAGPDVAMSESSITTLLGGEVGRKLGMHVVAASPLYLSPQQVPQDIVEKETAIFRYVFAFVKACMDYYKHNINNNLLKYTILYCILYNIYYTVLYTIYTILIPYSIPYLLIQPQQRADCG